MAIGSVLSAGVGFSNTPNPYNSSYYASIGRSAQSADTPKLSYGGTSMPKTADSSGKQGTKFRDGFAEDECQTCKNRKYQDVSNDSGVSFQSPTKLSKGEAMSAVRAHEHEHVSRNQSAADREGREIVSQSVRIKTGICPECGEVYVEGGETRTVSRNKTAQKFSAGLENGAMSGRTLDTVA